MTTSLSGDPSNRKGSHDLSVIRQATLSERLLRGIDKISARMGQASRLAPHLATGLRGEEAALFHLKARGYVIVARRWNTPKLQGDIDLIAWDKETLCFIEVKTRAGRNIVPAEFSVDEHKQKTLRTLASIFRKCLPEPLRSQTLVRFDVVAVYLPHAGTRGETEVELFPAAFSRYAKARGV